ncbi:hypothetical protein [Rhodococcus sp. 114MFTsu3.1]|uniref:hypothetical protein n=1 Tax=Rhodococcus sp. 114MFTsu3.1 TaxID=1172184 RepID=UPI0012DC6567|nr:hypothetical protein [Rhodococcus sp. 114MFTsu3.1]
MLPDVDVFPVDGKSNVIATARTLVQWVVENFWCVTDRDFDDPRHLADLSAVHCHYELTDLEAMLIHYGVLSDLIMHIGSSAKIEKWGGPEKVVNDLVILVEPVSALRESSRLNGWGLPFDDVSLTAKIDKSSLTLNLNSYCRALISKSSAPPTFQTVLEAALKGPSATDVYRGKDVITAISVALRKCVGTLPMAAADPDHVAAQVRGSAGLALSRSKWLEALRENLGLS